LIRITDLSVLSSTPQWQQNYRFPFHEKETSLIFNGDNRPVDTWMTNNKAENEIGKRVYLANQKINRQINFLDLHEIRTRVSKPSAWNTSQIPEDL
jgi:hypothetical protein